MKKAGHSMKTTENTGPTIIRYPVAKGFVGSDEDLGYTHILTETVWRLSDLLLILAGNIEPCGGGEDDAHSDASGGDGFHRQVELIAYAAELKEAAAAQLDDEDGAQCHAHLAEIAANDAFIEKNHAAIAAREQAERDQAVKSPERDQAGQNQSPMHA
jgi:hypothetical protein